ncbi:MAG: hypothetical protein EA401_09025 [Planctomycetota bacterium]|nr:MAG: hypothetical protein EA401_09025 [Planctomycetota bacterium]
MATPQRIYNIYRQLHRDAETIYDFQVAAGGRISGTVTMLRAGDAALPLRRWAEEMHELIGVLRGTHDDPYIMEATQTWYWASIYAVLKDQSWEDLDFAAAREQAPRSQVFDCDQLAFQVDRLAALGPEQAPPRKLFLLWCVADVLYRQATPPAQQRSIEEIMEVDLQDMLKRSYLKPVIEAVPA